MKKIIAIGLLLINTLSFAQDKLEVTYSSRLILPDDFKFEAPGGGGGRQMPKEMQEQMMKRLQEPQESVLTILGDQSIYKAVEKISNDQLNGGGRGPGGRGPGGPGMMRMSGDNIYKDISTSSYMKVMNLFTKEYTVKDNLPHYDWKISRETKTILGNEAKKATTEKDGQTIVAWFTSKIPSKTGPDSFWGLPGLILEVESNINQGFFNGKRIITITDIKTKNDKKELEAPKAKNIITEAELEKLQQEQRSRFEQMRDQGVNKRD